jgi:hypothetical protein
MQDKTRDMKEWKKKWDQEIQDYLETPKPYFPVKYWKAYSAIPPGYDHKI